MPPRYGRLEVGVTADTRGLEQQIQSASVKAGQNASRQIGTSLSRGMAGVGRVMQSVGKAAATGLGVATAAAAGFGVASFKTAARVGEMDATLRALARANGLSYDAMQRVVSETRAFGIEAGVAQNLVAQFARNQLDLSKSTELARVAQDAAVISGENSSDVLDRLIHGITTQNSLVLRNAGVNVQAGQAMDKYAKSVGKSRNELTPTERAQAVLNEVIAAGVPIAGAYTTAMQEPGKVLRSFPRLLNDVQLSIGQGLVGAFKPAILGGYEFAKVLSLAIGPGGRLRPVVDGIAQSVVSLTRPLAPLITRWTAWIKALQPGQVEKITDRVRRFGPAAVAAAGGLAAMAAPAVLQGIPLLGPLMSNLTGPVRQVGTELFRMGNNLVGNAMAARGLTGPLGALKAGFGLLTSPVGLLVAGLALALAVSPELRRAVLDLVGALGGALRPVLAIVVEVLRALARPLAEVGRAFGVVLAGGIRVLIPLLRVVSAVIDGLGPALVPLTYAVLAGAAAWKVYQGAVALVNFARLVPFLVQYVAQIQLVALWQGITATATKGWAAAQVIAAAASKVWAAAQWLLNASFLGFPLVWIVAAIAAVIAVIVVIATRTDWFQRIWRVAWAGISAAISWAWNNAIKPAALAIIRIWAVQIQAVLRLAAIIWAACRSIAAGWEWARAATARIWAAISAVITAAANLIRAVTGAAVGWVTSRVAAGWAAVRNSTAVAWGQQITGAIAGAWNRIRGVTTAATTWIMARLAAVWAQVRATAAAAWNGTVATIASIWNRVREVVRAPVAWVVNNVINRLVGGINALITKVGLPAIPKITGFARGGQVPEDAALGPASRFGRDRVIAAVEPGEWILTRRQARRIGYGNLRRLPHYQEGGPVGHVPIAPAFGLGPVNINLPAIGNIARGAWDKAWGFTREVLRIDDIAKLGGELVDQFSGMLRWAAAQAFRVLVAPLRKAAEGMLAGPLFPGQWLAKTAISAIDAAITFIEGHSAPDYMGGGAGVDELAREVMRRFPGLRITSALRPGDTKSYHSRNMARDLGGPVPLMNAAGRWMAQNMYRELIEGIHNPPLSVKNGARVAPSFWGAATWAGHRDHIHMAASEGGGGGPAGAGVERWRPLVEQIARMKGIPHTVGAWMRQIATESGGNANAVQQVRDINWPNNLARGLLQVIPTTFRAQAGNPFGTNIMDPRANIWAAMTYAIKRYGARLLQVIGRGRGYARGGIVREHIIGIGQTTGRRFDLGEAGPELVTPLTGPGAAPEIRLGDAGRRPIEVNVYPRAGQSETEVARAVVREVAWAQAGGRA